MHRSFPALHSSSSSTLGAGPGSVSVLLFCRHIHDANAHASPLRQRTHAFAPPELTTSYPPYAFSVAMYTLTLVCVALAAASAVPALGRYSVPSVMRRAGLDDGFMLARGLKNSLALLCHSTKQICSSRINRTMGYAVSVCIPPIQHSHLRSYAASLYLALPASSHASPPPLWLSLRSYLDVLSGLLAVSRTR